MKKQKKQQKLAVKNPERKDYVLRESRDKNPKVNKKICRWIVRYKSVCVRERWCG